MIRPSMRMRLERLERLRGQQEVPPFAILLREPLEPPDEFALRVEATKAAHKIVIWRGCAAKVWT